MADQAVSSQVGNNTTQTTLWYSHRDQLIVSDCISCSFEWIYLKQNSDSGVTAKSPSQCIHRLIPKYF